MHSLPQPHPSHDRARSLFGALVDEELSARDAEQVRDHLKDCEHCREVWQDYSNAVMRVRGLEREQAPTPLASLILRRVRRRSFLTQMRGIETHFRVPAELLIVLLAGAVGTLLLMLWQS